MSTEATFDWKRLGDVAVGRDSMGGEMPVAVYRLMQYTLMDELKDRYGENEAHEIFRSAGRRAGRAFAENLLDESRPFNTFIAQLQQRLRELKIGIMRIEAANMDTLEFSLCIEEDLDCSGLPVSGETVCWYDEGFIAGILQAYTKKDFVAVEVDCWSTGGTACRFEAYPAQKP